MVVGWVRGALEGNNERLLNIEIPLLLPLNLHESGDHSPINIGSFQRAGRQILVWRSRLWSAPELQYGWFTEIWRVIVFAVSMVY